MMVMVWSLLSINNDRLFQDNIISQSFVDLAHVVPAYIHICLEFSLLPFKLLPVLLDRGQSATHFVCFGHGNSIPTERATLCVEQIRLQNLQPNYQDVVY